MQAKLLIDEFFLDHFLIYSKKKQLKSSKDYQHQYVKFTWNDIHLMVVYGIESLLQLFIMNTDCR